ncbi:MAG: flap endonuclease-1 [Candidatus Altiarchaeota archaeon]
MGVNLRDIIPQRSLEFEELRGKVIAVDALNSLYQFLASIRQADGTPLMDSNGNVTSHLSGLFYRTGRLLKLGIKPIYVFDGKPPSIKRGEIDRRMQLKREAQMEWERAKVEGRIEDAKKFAKRTSKLTDEMKEDSKKLLGCMGVPYVQAPSEGEAQCAHMVTRGDAWGVGSQDYDSILLGAPKLVKGLTLSGTLELSLIELEDALKQNGITREQLIDVAILVGTDFNDGVRGIGPKKGLKMVKEGRLGELDLDFDIDVVRKIFLNPDISDDYSIEWNSVDVDGLVRILSEKHDFSEERVRKTANEMTESRKEMSQQNLDKWF